MVSGRLRCLSLLFNGSADTTLRAPQRPCRSLSAIFHNPSHHESSTSIWPVATTSLDHCGFLRGTAALTDRYQCTTRVDSVLLASSDTSISSYSVLDSVGEAPCVPVCTSNAEILTMQEGTAVDE